MSEDNRTIEEVYAAQGSVVGCCNRNADNQGCDCLPRAIERSRKKVEAIFGAVTPWPPSFDAEREKIIQDLYAASLRNDKLIKDLQTELAEIKQQRVHWVNERTDKDKLIKGLSERVEAQKEILQKNAQKTDLSIDRHEGKKYIRRIVGVTQTLTTVKVGDKDYPAIDVDVYAVLKAFGVTSQPIGHACKKLLACGKRGKGYALSDLRGVIAAVSRAIEETQQEETAPQPTRDSAAVTAFKAAGWMPKEGSTDAKDLSDS